MIIRGIAQAIFLFSIVASASAQQQAILLKAHSHNDYKRRHPLHDALNNGFFSIEADVFYENGRFIVAHTKAGIRKKNTLEKIYLQPLLERAVKNNNKVYAHGPLEFELMIDLKDYWDSARLDSLKRLIENYAGLFTAFNQEKKTSAAVRILLSGNGAKYLAAEHNPRYFSIDGGFGDFESQLDSNIICRTSASFRSLFDWQGIGNMPERERKMLDEFVTRAHASGRKIRFWAATSKRKVWKELLDAGVDRVNVDKLKKFRKFYAGYYD